MEAIGLVIPLLILVIVVLIAIAMDQRHLL